MPDYWLMSQVRRLRHGEVNCHTQGHTPDEWLSQDPNLGCCSPATQHPGARNHNLARALKWELSSSSSGREEDVGCYLIYR